MQPVILERIIEQAQIGLQKALFRYETAQYHVTYAQSQLDIYQEIYFKAKDKLNYLVGE